MRLTVQVTFLSHGYVSRFHAEQFWAQSIFIFFAEQLYSHYLRI